MGCEFAQVVHGSDRLEEPVGVGLGYVAAEVLADLVLVEGQQRQDQIVSAPLVLATLAVEEGEFLFDAPEELRPAGQEEAGARILLLGVLFAEVEDFEKGSGQALSVTGGEVDEDLVETVEDDQGELILNRRQDVVDSDGGERGVGKELGQERAQSEVLEGGGGEVSQVEVDGQGDLFAGFPEF